MPTMTLLCVGHGRVSASTAAGASEAGAAKALSDGIIPAIIQVTHIPVADETTGRCVIRCGSINSSRSF